MPGGKQEVLTNPLRQKVDSLLVTLFYGGILLAVVALGACSWAAGRTYFLAPQCQLATLEVRKAGGDCPLTANEIRFYNSAARVGLWVMLLSPLASVAAYLALGRLESLYEAADAPTRKKQV